MRSVRLTLVLPVLLVLVTEIAIQIGQHSQPPVRGDIYWTSTPELTVAGLNAPAELVSIASFKLLGGSIGHASGHIIYLLFVAGLWVSIGWYFDNHGSPNNNRWLPWWVRTTSKAFLILLGVYGLIIIMLHNVVFTSPANVTGGGSNFTGDVVRQALTLAWSLLLMIIPLWSLARRKNAQRSAA